MSDPEKVLVAGATGKQGGAVARALLREGYKVKALTRNPASAAAGELRKLGAEIAVGDLTHEDSLAEALKGVRVVFAMTTPFQSDHDTEVAQGKNIVDAAKSAGVSHLVFSSVASADKNTGVPHFETKFKVEQHIVRSGVPYTIIGPTAFMENFIQPFALPNLRQGKISRGLPASRAVQLVAVEDIGSFAAFVIQHRDEFLDERIDIAGDERTGEETAVILAKISGRPIRYEGFPPANLKAQSPDLAIMMEWQAKNDYTADIGGLRHDFPEVGWHRLEEWARGIDWKTLLTS
ncbi:MAG: NmrA/HSCARG family protein [Bacteroidetes bacterium]|nr:NmrA/HSCARG family protein [Bacteroidota bacterium]